MLTRNELVWCKEPPKVYDHDYPYLADEKAVPHGVYDIKQNKGYVTLGNNAETAEFVTNNILWWWQNVGCQAYPNATRLLILCDSGGANGYRHYAFRKNLQRIAKIMGIRILVTHYPPYCSKYNPIERQLFAQMQRTIKGHILTHMDYLKQRFEETTTNPDGKPPLQVFVRVDRTVYKTKLPSAKNDIDKKRIFYHPDMPLFNYSILP